MAHRRRRSPSRLRFSPCLAALAGCVALLSAQPAQASPPGVEPCWTEAFTTYPVPYPYGAPDPGADGRTGWNLPDCRWGYPGVGDRTEYKDRNRRYPFDDLKTNPNPGYNNKKIWPLTDSFKRVLAYLDHSNGKWFIRPCCSPSNPPMYTENYTGLRLTLQGKACMDDESWRVNRAVISFDPQDDTAIEYRIRGFIQIAALPTSPDVQGLANNPEYDTGCLPGTTQTAATNPISNPNYHASNERFVGEDDRDRAYQTWNAKANYGSAIYVAYPTTGVHGGGTATAIVRAGADRAQILGYFGYCDPNVRQKSPARNFPVVMGWWYANIWENGTRKTRVNGYVGQRAC